MLLKLYLFRDSLEDADNKFIAAMVGGGMVNNTRRRAERIEQIYNSYVETISPLL